MPPPRLALWGWAGCFPSASPCYPTQRRKIFSTSQKQGGHKATDVFELSRQSPALKSVYTNRKAVLLLYVYIPIKVFCCIFAWYFCSVEKKKKREHESYKSNFIKKASLSNSEYFAFYSFSSSLFWSASLSHPMFRKQPEPQKSG